MSSREPGEIDRSAPRDWQPALGGAGIVRDTEDIAQCIRVILTTPFGSVPHRPRFATELDRYIDWPFEEAKPRIVQEARRAILEFEPRVGDLLVRVVKSGAHLEVLTSFRPKGAEEFSRADASLRR